MIGESMNQLENRTGQLAPSMAQLDYLIVDSSSSMMDKWVETTGAVSAYVKGVQAANLKSDVVLHMFYSQNPDYIHWEGPIEQWAVAWPLPQGGTPLYDAIRAAGLRLRSLNPQRCSIVIATDGEEDGSEVTDLAQAQAIIKWMRAKGWQVTFIGCDFSNAKQAKALGMDKNNSIGVQKRLMREAAENLAKKRANYGLYGAPMTWSEEEQQNFGGYLAPPK